MSRSVNNIGVGKVELSMLNLTTTSIAHYGDTATPMTDALLDAGANAVSLISSHEIGITAATTAPLFGACLALSDNNNSNSFPARAVVQVAGVAEMQGTTGAIAAPRVAPAFRPCQRNGLVAQDTTTPDNTLDGTRGIVINVWDTDRVDVLF